MNDLALAIVNKEILKQTKNRWQIFKTKELQALAKIESSLMKGARKYIEEKGFVEIMAPHMTKATGSCENFMTVFELDYFGQRSYLSQTAQLYLEVLTPFLKKVWTVIHSFRAEPDVDGRHLTEFPLIEIEFEGNFEELIEYIEGIINSMIATAAKESKEELKIFGIHEEDISIFKPPYKRLSYSQAIELLQEKRIEINWGDDIKSSHEKTLCKTLNFKPFFLTHWPTTIKFFDMKNNDENPNIVNSCDLILPYSGEAVGGAEREHIYQMLEKKLGESKMLELLKQRGGRIEDFEWFLDFYNNHKVNLHSGCGIGFNRVTQSLLRTDDIRACTVFPLNRETIW